MKRLCTNANFSDFQVDSGSGIGMNMTQSMFVEPAFSTMLSMKVPNRVNGASAVQFQALDMDDNWASQSIMYGSLCASSNDFGEILATQMEDGMLFSLTQQPYSSTTRDQSHFPPKRMVGKYHRRCMFRKLMVYLLYQDPKPKGLI